MKILVLNSGSSSLKYQLFDMTDESVLAKGLVERIGLEGSLLTHRPANKEKQVINTDIPDHTTAIQLVLDALTNPDYGVISSMDEIGAVGHRIVHGGSVFTETTIINDEVVAEIEKLIPLAPLHNPPGIAGIKACRSILPNVPQVAVFDTAFHQSMPEVSYIYGLPYEYFEKYGIRRYGFHGTSHRYVSHRAAEILGEPLEDLKMITCHLGNGSSIAAIDKGKVMDTTMGFTPLEGLMMGARSGNVDPAIISFIMEKENLTIKEVDELLNKKSGFLGVSGVSSDLRNVEEAASEGNYRAQLAIDMFYQKIVRFIGAFVAEINGIDVLVFTAGIGENSPQMREAVCDKLEFLCLFIDKEKNKFRGEEREISRPGSKVKVFVIPTNEELMIARDTATLVK
ncbi:acetate kinase [Dehalobacterium formicoaceticum]|uniref:Acetate kinase n=1 Tax=Dehalobacterium formicoaceticum TaxID=51515 RepID=A0ABT1Y9F9_9FIRM|nr:acetate kinase [Dehalobacterium formicoaceticum]MCR6546296.1 acetate kinase [Dehalobacterium formicoaceticum]